MTKKMPPIPPANRSSKGPGGDRHVDPRELHEEPPADSDQKGQEANTRQNTTHQGYQQDR